LVIQRIFLLVTLLSTGDKVYGFKTWAHPELGDHLFGRLGNLFQLWTYGVEDSDKITNTCCEREIMISQNSHQEQPAGSEHSIPTFQPQTKRFPPEDVHK